jgi:hypothetical protein
LTIWNQTKKDVTQIGAQRVRASTNTNSNIGGKNSGTNGKHRGAAVHWFQNGHPMKTMIERHDEMLGVDEKTAQKFCKEWYRSKRQETAAIWKQRKQKLGNEQEFSISELQEQVKEIVKRKRNMKPPENTLSNNEYNNLQREGLKQLIEVEKNRFNQQSMLR